MIARKHMLETKNEKDFSLSASVQNPDMLPFCVPHEWCWLKPFLTLKKGQLLSLLFPPRLRFCLLMNCFLLLTQAYHLGCNYVGSLGEKIQWEMQKEIDNYKLTLSATTWKCLPREPETWKADRTWGWKVARVEFKAEVISYGENC